MVCYMACGNVKPSRIEDSVTRISRPGWAGRNLNIPHASLKTEPIFNSEGNASTNARRSIWQGGWIGSVRSGHSHGGGETAFSFGGSRTFPIICVTRCASRSFVQAG